MFRETRDSTQYRLGDLQLAIMRVLWHRGEAAVSEVHAALHEERGLAPTTVATMLTKLEKKGAVTHRKESRKFIYAPRISESEVRQSMVAELKNRLFHGNTTAFVSHLLAEHDLDPKELERLKAAITAKEEESC
ncbi:MAG: BlaI/MecI/CopY family transcriptional regulator [Acidobacteriota bacterium]